MGRKARRPRNPAQRLRTAVEVLPRRTRIAMLRGMDDNRIIAGGYTDKEAGGICPMLAAHRNGGRTSLGSFARAWDRFTGARRPRLATGRELRALRSYIELSLLREDQDEASVAGLARGLRAQREKRHAQREKRHAQREKRRVRADAERPRRADTGERNRAPELRRRWRWAWLIPTRRYDVFAERVAAAQERSSEQRASELLTRSPARAGSPPSG